MLNNFKGPYTDQQKQVKLQIPVLKLDTNGHILEDKGMKICGESPNINNKIKKMCLKAGLQ